MKCPKCGTAPHTPIQIKRAGMCRWCEKTKLEETIDPDIQFVLSGEGACYCTNSLICSPCGKEE